MRAVPIVSCIRGLTLLAVFGIADHTPALIAQGNITRLLDDAPPNNLPDQLTSFVGRVGELDEVRGLLRGRAW